MILKVLDAYQRILTTYSKEEEILKGFHKENSERKGLPHLMEKSKTYKEAETCLLRMKKYF